MRGKGVRVRGRDEERWGEQGEGKQGEGSVTSA